MQKLNVSIVVAVYNEESTLEKTIKMLDSFFKEIADKYEIIVVESGSTDNTPRIVDKLSKMKHVKGFHQKEKEGFGSGLREGYKNCKLDWVWYMDADLPFDISEFKKALPYLDGYDAVIGYKKEKKESFMRWFLSLSYNMMIKALFKLKFRDINYSFKLIRRSMLKRLDLRSTGWFIDAEILIELKKYNAKVKEIHIPFKVRKFGKSKVYNYPRTIAGFLKEVHEYKSRQ